MIHTKSKKLANEFASRMRASRILVNSPGTQGIMGACTGLTRVRERLFEAGQTINEQGEAANTMYLIREGTVDTFHNGEPHQTLGPGNYFGEVAIYNETTRSRTIVASTQVRVLEIEREMAKLLRRHFEPQNY